MSEKDTLEEQMLKQGKELINKREVPFELEGRLREALFNVNRKQDENNVNVVEIAKKKRSYMNKWKGAAAAILVVVFLTIIIQYEALAYFARSQFGYTELVGEAITQLYEQGRGQELKVEDTLSDGTTLRLDWIIADDNQTIINYTLHNESGLAERYTSGHFSLKSLSGRLTNARIEHGASELDSEGKTIRGVAHFDKVSLFTKKLTLHYFDSLANQSIENSVVSNHSFGELEFDFDPNKALKTVIKKRIRHTFELKDGSIKVQKIIATPTETIISGKLLLSAQLFNIADLSNLQLYVDGKPLEYLGSGKSSGLSGRNFEIRYSPLPSELETIELVLEQFNHIATIQASMQLQHLSENPTSYEYANEIIYVEGYEQENGQTKVTIRTKDGLLLDGVVLETEHGEHSLMKTVDSIQMNDRNQESWHQRNLVFETMDKPMNLHVKGLKLNKIYNESFTILE